jgi:hypothetical protein
MRSAKSIRLLIISAILFCPAFTAVAQERTIIKSASAARMLLGRHRLSLQWVSWDYFGTANVTNVKGVYRVKGEQRGRGKSTDYVRIDGIITSISPKEFKFDGTVEMRVSHINGGQPCIREGELTFAITKNRRYWRMQEMDNPCDTATDYVDIYFR